MSAFLSIAAVTGVCAALAGLGALACLAGATHALWSARRARLTAQAYPSAAALQQQDAARAEAASVRLWKGAVWFAVAAAVWLALSVGLAIFAGGVTP